MCGFGLFFKCITLQLKCVAVFLLFFLTFSLHDFSSSGTPDIPPQFICRFSQRVRAGKISKLCRMLGSLAGGCGLNMVELMPGSSVTLLRAHYAFIFFPCSGQHT